MQPINVIYYLIKISLRQESGQMWLQMQMVPF